MLFSTEENNAFNKAKDFFNMHQYQDALHWYKQLLEYQNGYERKQVYTYYSIAQCYLRVAKLNEAIKYFHTSFELAKKHYESSLEGLALYHLALSYAKQRNYRLAIKYYEQSIDYSEMSPHMENIEDSYLGLGTIYTSAGYFEKANNCFARAMNFASQKNNKGAWLDAHIKKASNYKAWEQFEDAEQTLKPIDHLITENYFRDNNIDFSILADYYDTKGNIIYKKDKFETFSRIDEAFDCIKKAYEITKKYQNHDKRELARMTNNLANMYLVKENVSDAKFYYLRSLQLFESINDISGQSTASSNIGDLLTQEKNLEEAESYLFQALKFEEQINRPRKLMSIGTNLGKIYIELNRYDDAIKYLMPIIDLTENLLQQGDDVQKRTFFQSLFPLYTILARCFLKKKNYSLLFKYEELRRNKILYQKLCDKYNVSETFSLQKVQAQLREDEAIMTISSPKLTSIIQVVITKNQVIAKEIKDFNFTRDTNIDLFNKRLDIMEYLSREEWKEIWKWESPQNKNKQTILDENTIVKESLDREVQSQQYFSKKKKIFDINTELRGLEVEIETYLYLLTERGEYVQEKGLTDNDKLLNSLTQLVENDRKLETLKKGETLDFNNTSEDDKDENLETIRKYDKKTINVLARWFHSLLIEPHLSILQNIKSLTILPEGHLTLLPFETLMDENRKYLIEDVVIKYAQSVNIQYLLKSIKSQQHTKNNILVIGDAEYENQTVSAEADIEDRMLKRTFLPFPQVWKNLKASPKEIGVIQELFSQEGQNLVISKNKVNKNNLLSLSKDALFKNYKYLHLSLHGYQNGDEPGLVLSRPNYNGFNREDQYLFASEIENLNLDVEFVNAAICQGGIGHIYEGEGILGLQAAFLLAGVQSSSVTLWDVLDSKTSTFMKSFYHEIINNGKSIPEALAETKRQFINGRYKNKVYWAPFLYYGI